MPQIINQPRTGFWDTFAQTAGPHIGEALSSGIGSLAQHKLNQVLERQQQVKFTNALEGLGYTPQQAQQLSQFGPQLLAPIIKEQARARVSQDVTSPGLQAIVPGLGAAEAQAIGKLSPGLQQAWYRNVIGDLAAAQQQGRDQQQDFSPQEYQHTPQSAPESQQQIAPADLLSLLQGSSPQAQLAAQLGQQARPVTPATPSTAPTLTPESNVVKELKSDEERRKEHAAQKEAEKKLREDKKEIAAERKRSITERALEEKSKREAKKAEAQDTKEKFKFNKDLRESIIKDSQSARSQLTDLSRIDELNKSGKLDTPGYVEFLKRSGLDIPALMNPESEEFQKIVQNFTKDAKTYFGGRVSNFEVEQFLKTVPSLSQSPEGRNRVMSNLKRLSQAKLDYYNTYKEILRDNKGVPPYDLLEQLEDRMESKYEKLSEAFRKSLEKKVPAGQNRLITALQATVGSIAGIPGAVIGGIGKLLSSAGSSAGL